jgi:hypothetical protein
MFQENDSFADATFFFLHRYQNTYYRVHEILTGLMPENVPEVATQLEAVEITELPVLAHVITMVYEKVRCVLSVRDSGGPTIFSTGMQSERPVEAVFSLFLLER